MRRFIKFCCVGIANTLVDYIVFIMLAAWVPLFMARGFSWIASCLFSYTVNRAWTFKALDTGIAPFIRFTTINAISLALGVILLYFFTSWGFEKTAAFFLSLPFTLLSNFLGYRYWSFRKFEQHQ